MSLQCSNSGLVPFPLTQHIELNTGCLIPYTSCLETQSVVMGLLKAEKNVTVAQILYLEYHCQLESLVLH